MSTLTALLARFPSDLATSTIAGGGAVFTRSTATPTARLRPPLPLPSTSTQIVRLDDISPAVLAHLHRGEGRAAERSCEVGDMRCRLAALARPRETSCAPPPQTPRFTCASPVTTAPEQSP